MENKNNYLHIRMDDFHQKVIKLMIEKSGKTKTKYIEMLVRNDFIKNMESLNPTEIEDAIGGRINE